MLSREATVWRDGRRQQVPAQELVPGDIIQISAGARIPADLRLLRVKNLEVQEAALTGESNAVAKQRDAAESMVLLAAVLSGMMLPVTPVQILWVNMITAVTLGVSLAWEKAEVGLMQRRPHSTEEGLLGGFDLWRIAYVGTALLLGVGFLFAQEQSRGESSLEYASTMAVNALVLGQIFYLLNSRFFRRSALSWEGLTGNRMVLLAIAGCIGLQLIFTYAPFMNQLLESRPLDAEAWLRCVAVGLGLFILVEIEKFVRRKRSADGAASGGL